MNDIELDLAKFAPPRWAVKDLLDDGFSILAAKKGIGKSWWADQVALSIAHNLAAFNAYEVNPGHVILITNEDTEFGIQDRLRKQREALGIKPNGKLHVYTEWPSVDEGGLARLEGMCIDLKPRLVILDVLRKFQRTSGAYNAASEKIDVIAKVSKQTQTGIVGVMHMYRGDISPSRPDWLDRIQGSIGITGAARTIIGLTRQRDSDEAVMRVTGKTVAEATVAMKFDPNKLIWTAGGEFNIKMAEASDIRKRIFGVIQAQGGATALTISEELGVSYDTIYQRLWQMVRQGQLLRRDLGDETMYITESQASTIKAAASNQQTGFEDAWEGHGEYVGAATFPRLRSA